MQKIKKIGVVSLAYNLALVSFLISLTTSLLFLIFSKIPNFAEVVSQSYPEVLLASPQALIYNVFVSTVTGFIFGILLAFFYNLVTKWTGGVSVSLSNLDHKEAKGKK